MGKHDEQVCADKQCLTVPRRSGLPPDGFALNVTDDGNFAIATVPPSFWHPEVRFEIMRGPVPGDGSTIPPTAEGFSLNTADPCGSGVMLDQLAAVVETDDCNGVGHAFLYRVSTQSSKSIIDRLDFNAYGAWPVKLGGNLWGLVAPAEYSVVIFEPTLARRDVVDLVPIQAESTSTPTFFETHGRDSTSVIASPTGGVGIIDPTLAVLSSAWIIPRCEASP